MKLLVIDIGGTFIKYGIYNVDKFKLTNKGKILTPHENQSDLFNTIKNIANESPSVEGCSISMPGTIDTKRGYVFQGGALQYNNGTYFAKVLRDKLGLPVTINNDARSAALAEQWQGRLKNVDNALVLVLGTGLGCSIVQNGNIYEGSHNYAGEFSVIFTKGFKKNGSNALLGNQVSVPLLVDEISRIYGKKLSGIEAMNVVKNKANANVCKLFDDYLENFAVQIFNFQIMFDPEIILIGGGISQNNFFMDCLKRRVESIFSLLPFEINHSEIESCLFSNDANLIGSAKTFLDQSQI